MKPIPIHEDLYLDRDARQWILTRRVEVSKSKDPTKNGTYRFDDIGYYPKLSQLSTKAAELIAKDIPAESILELITAIQTLSATLMRKVGA